VAQVERVAVEPEVEGAVIQIIPISREILLLLAHPILAAVVVVVPPTETLVRLAKMATSPTIRLGMLDLAVWVLS
jgi:hypothetical protein